VASFPAPSAVRRLPPGACLLRLEIHVEVAVEYSPAERGCPTKFELLMRLPDDLPDEQVERLRVIAAKCPVHRALDGEVMFQERIERVHLAA